MKNLIPAISSSVLALAALMGVGSAIAAPFNGGSTIRCKPVQLPTFQCPAGKTITSGVCKTVMVTKTICKPVDTTRKSAVLRIDGLPTALPSTRA